MAERHLLYALRVNHSIVVYCRCSWCGVYDSDGALHHDMRGRYEEHGRIAAHAITRLRETEQQERERVALVRHGPPPAPPAPGTPRAAQGRPCAAGTTRR
jgi:hypothetical protein